MQTLQRILAVMFAILIASPACCCTAMSAPVREASHSCCGGVEKDHEHSVCDCSVKKQALCEKDKPVPAAPVFALPPAPESPVPAIAPAILSTDLPVAAYIDTGPPRLRLAMLQRYLI